MGGYNAGEIASGMAVTFISLELGSWLPRPAPGLAGKCADAGNLRPQRQSFDFQCGLLQPRL